MPRLKKEIKEKDDTIAELAQIHQQMKEEKTLKIKELNKKLSLIGSQNDAILRGPNGGTPLLLTPSQIKTKVGLGGRS